LNSAGTLENEYRKKLVSDTWHLCSNCSQWPSNNYISSEQLPDNQMTICNECIVKNQQGDCKRSSRNRSWPSSATGFDRK